MQQTVATTNMDTIYDLIDSLGHYAQILKHATQVVMQF